MPVSNMQYNYDNAEERFYRGVNTSYESSKNYQRRNDFYHDQRRTGYEYRQPQHASYNNFDMPKKNRYEYDYNVSSIVANNGKLYIYIYIKYLRIKHVILNFYLM